MSFVFYDKYGNVDIKTTNSTSAASIATITGAANSVCTSGAFTIPAESSDIYMFLGAQSSICSIILEVVTDGIESVSIDPNPCTPFPYGTMQMSASVLPETASQDVTWSCTAPSDVATISTTGLVEVKTKEIKSSSGYKIRATSNTDPTKFAECELYTTVLNSLTVNETVTPFPSTETTTVAFGIAPANIVGCTWTKVDDNGYIWYYSRPGESSGSKYRVKSLWERAIVFELTEESKVTLKSETSSTSCYYLISTDNTASNSDRKVTISDDGVTEFTLSAGKYYLGAYPTTVTYVTSTVGGENVFLTEIKVEPIVVDEDAPIITFTPKNSLTLNIGERGYLKYEVENSYSSYDEVWTASADNVQIQGSGVIKGVSQTSSPVIITLTLYEKVDGARTGKMVSETATVTVSAPQRDLSARAKGDQIAKWGSWTFGGTQKDYYYDINNGGGTVRIVADDEHRISASKNGYIYSNSTSGDKKGSLMFMAPSKGTVKVSATASSYDTRNPQISTTNTTLPSSTFSWGNFLTLEANDDVKVGDKLVITISTPTENTWPIVSLRAYNWKYAGEYDRSVAYSSSDQTIRFQIDQTLLDRMKGVDNVYNAYENQKLILVGDGFKVKSIGVEKEVSRNVSIDVSAGGITDNSFSVDAGTTKVHYAVLNDEIASRHINIGASPGITINQIEWIPEPVFWLVDESGNRINMSSVYRDISSSGTPLRIMSSTPIEFDGAPKLSLGNGKDKYTYEGDNITVTSTTYNGEAATLITLQNFPYGLISPSADQIISLPSGTKIRTKKDDGSTGSTFTINGGESVNILTFKTEADVSAGGELANPVITNVERDDDNVKITIGTEGEGSASNLELLWDKANGEDFRGVHESTGVVRSGNVYTIPKSLFESKKVRLMAKVSVSSPSYKDKYSRQMSIQGVDGGRDVLINTGFDFESQIGWEGEDISSWSGGDGSNKCAEQFQGSFDIYQSLENLTKGVYKITAQAFYRTTDYDKAYEDYEGDVDGGKTLRGDSKVLSYLYGNNYSTPVKNIFEEGVSSSNALNGYVQLGDGNMHYPNDMTSAADAFTRELYKVSFYAIVEDDGKLKVGIFGNRGTESGRWTIWDNFSVEKINSDVHTDELRKLPGSYKWSLTNGKFGKVGTRYSGENGVHVVDNGYIEYINSSNNRAIEVCENGLKLETSYIDNGVHFIIPGPGTIKVKGGQSTNIKLSNQGFVKVNSTLTYPTKNDQSRVVADATFNTNFGNEIIPNKEGECTYEYTGSGEAHVLIGVNNYNGDNYIREIEYLFNPGNLIVHKTKGEYEWTGSTNADWKSDYNPSEGATYTEILNNHQNDAGTRDLRIIADDSHSVKVSSSGFEFTALADESFGYIMFPATVSGTVKVYTDGDAVGKNLSIAVGNKTTAATNYVPLADVDGDGLARTVKLFTKGEVADRMVYITAEPGLKITKIVWIPEYVNGVSNNLRVVEEEMAWARNNQFGGYDIPKNENTFIVAPQNKFINGDQGANRLNYGRAAVSGYPAVPNSTLLIYGGDIDRATTSDHPTYFTTSGNLMLNNTSNDAMRMVEFKVKGPGVVKVEAAGNGPTGRSVDIAAFGKGEVYDIEPETKASYYLMKASLKSHSITTDEGHIPGDDDSPTANEQEHKMDLVRHQHCSYHAVYAYLDAEDDDVHSIFVYAPDGGISIQEMHWYPKKTIYQVCEGNLSEEGSLKICDANGIERNIPDNIYLSPNKTGVEKPTWEPGEIKRQDSYSFYAKVTTNKLVSSNIKEPVWTTSQAGRKSFYDKWILTNAKVKGDADQHTKLNSDNSVPDGIKVAGKFVAITGKGGIGENVDNPYTLNKINTHVYAPMTEAQIADGEEPTGGYDRPAFGIMYVVSGTWEGNRNDMRRIEVLGPPTRLDLSTDVTEIYMEKGETMNLSATPVTEFNDLEAGGTYGKVIDMKYVEDPSAVTWRITDVEGSNVASVPEVTPENYPISADGRSEGTVITANNLGEAYLTVSIPGVFKYDYNGNSAWVETTLEKRIKIIVQEKVLTLTRVMLKDERVADQVTETTEENTTTKTVLRGTNYVENVDVISPQVYLLIGKRERLNFITGYFTNDLGNTPLEIPGEIKQAKDDNNWYVVFDVAKYLQNELKKNATPEEYEHTNYDAWHYVAFKANVNEATAVKVLWTETTTTTTTTTTEVGKNVVTTKSEPVTRSVDVPTSGSAEPVRVLTFKTFEDESGTELETYIYNVSQRGINADLNKDLTDNRLLTENVLVVPYTSTYINSDGTVASASGVEGTDADKATATTSWYSNHRSYIRLENFTTTVDGDDKQFKAGDKAKIIIKPYNTTYDYSKKNEAINRISLYVDPKSLPVTGEVKFNIGVTADGISPISVPVATIRNQNYVVYWQYDEANSTRWIHDAEITVDENIEIDQIKIEYYSGKSDTKTAYKTFQNYNVEGFKETVYNGMEFEGTADSEPGFKLAFKQNTDNRHFALRETYGRQVGVNRGEINKDVRVIYKNTLVVRDDKSDPCEFYIFSRGHLANIRSIEFIYEIDNEQGQNNLGARSLFCMSDPRFVPDNSQMHMIGWPLTDEALIEGDYGGEKSPNKTNEDVDDARTMRKLVYRPESPVNFAAFAMNCEEPGFLFVRKIIVRYDKDATSKRYVINNAYKKDGDLMDASEIKDIQTKTTGIKLTMPKADASKLVAGYLIKRTSLMNNTSQEITLTSTDEGALDLDNNKIVLNKYNGTGETHYLHKKLYTVRVLDKNRMVVRQMAFRITDNDMPKVTRYGGYAVANDNLQKYDIAENKELRTESPLDQIPRKIEITVSKSDGHLPANTVIVYTTDGTAPSVTFGGDNGRKILDINGEIGCGTGVTFKDEEGESGDKALTNLFSAYNNSIVIKALAMPLDLPTGKTFADYNTKDKLIGATCTYGEVSEVTRANYQFIEPDKTFFTTARRIDNNHFQTLLNGSPYDITDDSEVGHTQYFGATDDKFHGAYQPKVTDGNGITTMPEIFTYGGYELYDRNASGDHKFNHDILWNEYWQVKGNDATPWRGLREIVAGDTYVMSPLEPFSEKALPLYRGNDDRVITGNELTDFVNPNDPVRFFKGQFNYAEHKAKTQSYYRTWNLPCYGDYFRFEPESNGKLTVYVKQQGVLDQEDGHVDDQVLRLRPVYIFDERGETPADIYVTTTSKVSGDWMTMKHTSNMGSKYLNDEATDLFKQVCDQWIKNNTSKFEVDDDGKYVRDANGKKKILTEPQTVIVDDEEQTIQVPMVEYGDRAYESQGVIVLHGSLELAKKQTKRTLANGEEDELDYDGMRRDTKFTLNSGRTVTLADFIGTRDEGTEEKPVNPNGFMTISAGYVKYEFPVRAGKTYFMYASNGNLGFCSYTFSEDDKVYDASGNPTGETLTAIDGETREKQVFTIADDGATGAGDGVMRTLLTTYMNKTVSVKLNRNFYNNTWAAVVLPFSVSMHKLRKVFGDGVRVLHFNVISRLLGADYVFDGQNRHGDVDVISTRHHVHEMVVAGVPVFIRPALSESDPRIVNTSTGLFHVQFDDVTIETDKVEDVETNKYDYVDHGNNGTLYEHYTDYRCTGSFYYVNQAIYPGDIYMAAKTGLFTQRTYSSVIDMNGTRCWLTNRPATGEAPVGRILTLGNFSSASFGLGESETTGNNEGGVATEVDMIEVAPEDSADKVYNLKGQIVRNSADNLENLPQGVYIINGVKHVIK